jgi:putative ABC transport system permease protein
VIRVTLKGLLGRKLRLLLTLLAIVMGVGMVSGTYVLSDTINSSLRSLFAGVYANSDAVVTGKAVFGGSGEASSFPDWTAREDRAAPRRLGRRRRCRDAGGDRRCGREGRLARERIAARPEYQSRLPT